MNKAETEIDKARTLRNLYEGGATLEKVSEFGQCSRPKARQLIVQAGGKIRHRGIRRDTSPAILHEKLEALEKSVGVPIHPEVLKTIIDYTLGHNDGRTFRKVDRLHGYNGNLALFRKEQLENSYYIMGRLWRAVYSAVNLNVSSFVAYGVSRKDVMLCLNLLTETDKRKIHEWCNKHRPYIEFPNEEGVKQIVQACERTINGIVNSKLRFVYQYDPAYEKEDLASYLRIMAFKVATKYDWEVEDGKFAYQKALNYTKRSLWNASYLLIKQNTSSGYRRLERVDTEDRVYRTTTISLDNSEPEWLSMEEKLGEAADTSCEVVDLIDKLADPRLFQFMRLERESVPEFDEFVRNETGKDENDLYTSNYDTWRRLALHFSGLDKRKDRMTIKRKLRRELDLLDKSKVRRLDKGLK